MRPARGFTLIELLVATVLTAVAGSAVLHTLRAQQKFFGAASQIVAVRGQLRDGIHVLASDLRGASIARFGLPLMTDSAVELFATIGSSVVCAGISESSLGLAPAAPSGGTTLTALLTQPDTGDIALIYGRDSVDENGLSHSSWSGHRISGFASRSLATACPASTGFASGADVSAGRSGYLLTLQGAAGSGVRAGSPVRFVRRGRYSLYRSSDGAWYLGYRRCNALGSSVCGTIQPVSGPYLPYTRSGGASGSRGIGFRYYDADGFEVLDAALSPLVTRLDIVLRGETASHVAFAGDTRRPFRDSATVTVSPRNRAP